MPTKVILAVSMGFFAAGVGHGAETAKPKIIRLQPLDCAELEPFYREKWQNKNVSDKDNGVFIEVIDREHKPALRGTWSSTGKYMTDGKTQWINNVSVSPQRIVKVRIRKDANTLKYLIGTPDAPLFARYIALREIYEVAFSQEGRFALIEAGSRDPKAEMRYMAILKTRDFAPEAKVVPICTRALTDPALTVAHAACSLLIEFFDLRDHKTGARLDYGGFYTGPPESHYVREHSEVLEIAERLHAIDETLVTDEDLAMIRARRRPSEAWWKENYGKEEE